MTVHIALLRAVNVGGNAKVAMADLRDCVAQAGFDDVRTLLQSGNVVFRGGRESGAALERRLEAAAKQRLGLQTDFFVRSAREWAGVVANNPFPDEAKRDPGHLVVLALKQAPKAAAVEDLRAGVKGREAIHADGRQLYIVYPDGIGRSKLTAALIERKLGTRDAPARGTGRNWNTVLKLAQLAGA